jgi:2-keto-4-pentenoate hydratase/2-oxohepta-3-ene-1,7-dioic acid hydratase in catechol pathway
MRIITYESKASSKSGTEPRTGALIADGQYALDFRAALGTEAPSDVLAWCDLDGQWLPKAVALCEEVERDSARRDALTEKGAITPISDVRLVAPIPRPGKMVCVGLNYREHAAEGNRPAPSSPILFSKFTTAVTAPDGDVILPPASSKVDYEAELAVIIGRKAKGVSRERALDYVMGYMNFNDVSARDFQFGDGQFQRGKSCDTFAPMGPFIVTADEIPDPQRLSISFRLNGETMQNSNTSEMIFSVVDLIAFIAETITLEPGDVIATGTPSGVGFARTPPVFLKPGDLMEVEVEGLGILSNRVVSAIE